VHGLAGDIRQGNSYYEDPHSATGKFDFVMANPPFNVDRVDKERLKDDTARFPFGMPRADNANYLWIQLFYSSLNAKGRAGFVMANSAADARQSELEIRKALIEEGAVDVMIAIGSNFFYTVTLPCTLWFLDKSKTVETLHGSSESETLRATSLRNRDTVLFIDARAIFTQIDRAHREFTDAQIGLIASLVRLYRGEPVDNAVETLHCNVSTTTVAQLQPSQIEILESMFRDGQYRDIPGLCKVATRTEIEAQGWSLNPGRYVGVSARDSSSDAEFAVQLEELNEELEALNLQAHELEERIAENVDTLLGTP